MSINKRSQVEKNFCTGSSYQGQWDIEMNGYGEYRMGDGTIYRGMFKNGVFHGEGTLILPSKFRVVGQFVDGRCEKGQMFFGDGLEYRSKNWSYLTPTDRRYWAEKLDGIPPVGDSYLTKEKPRRVIPYDWYDTEEGFFDPHSGFLMTTMEPYERIRYIPLEERKWIIENCRRKNIDKVGFDPKIADSTEYFAKNVLEVKDSVFDIVWVSDDEKTGGEETDGWESGRSGLTDKLRLAIENASYSSETQSLDSENSFALSTIYSTKLN